MSLNSSSSFGLELLTGKSTMSTFEDLFGMSDSEGEDDEGEHA